MNVQPNGKYGLKRPTSKNVTVQQQFNNLDKLIATEELKEELGERYGDLNIMVEKMKTDLKRLADMTKRSKNLPIKMQHVYQYSKWDAIHEPYNVVENVLKDDHKVYKALTPNFDLTLNNGQPCFVSSVTISPGDTGPQTIEIYLSDSVDKWTLIKSYTSNKGAIQSLSIPNENIAKYLRVRCVNNVRGGNLVNLRLIQVKGLPSD